MSTQLSLLKLSPHQWYISLVPCERIVLYGVHTYIHVNQQAIWQEQMHGKSVDEFYSPAAQSHDASKKFTVSCAICASKQAVRVVLLCP